MAVIANTFLTLNDWANRLGPDGKVADVTDLLSQSNQILDDMLWTESNGPMGHTSVMRTGLPSSTFRAFYSGVPYSKSTTAKVTDTVGTMEAYSRVDRALADMSGDASTFRLGEDMAQIESMNQSMAQNLFYGSVAQNPSGFNGLAPRYSSLTKAANSVNVIDAGGTSANLTSIYVVCWGPTTAFGIFPKNTKAGLVVEDVTTAAPVIDENGLPYQAYQTHYEWGCGLVVRDWRFVVRIANIDCGALESGEGAADLLTLLTKAVYKIPVLPRKVTNTQTATEQRGGSPLSFGRPAIYANRIVETALDLQAQAKINLRLKYDEADGRPLLSFRGIPIRTVDALSTTEAKVS